MSATIECAGGYRLSTGSSRNRVRCLGMLRNATGATPPGDARAVRQAADPLAQVDSPERLLEELPAAA